MRNPQQYLKNQLKDKKEHPADHRYQSRDGVLWILPILGVILMLSAFLNTQLGVLPFFGFFLVLFWGIMMATSYRKKFNVLRAEYIARWKNEERVQVDMKKVYVNTFFCLMPLYFMLTLPAVVVVMIGELMAWLMVGVPATFISVVVMAAFSSIWKDLYLKLSRFWLMQLLIFLSANGFVLLFYFF